MLKTLIFLLTLWCGLFFSIIGGICLLNKIRTPETIAITALGILSLIIFFVLNLTKLVTLDKAVNDLWEGK